MTTISKPHAGFRIHIPPHEHTFGHWYKGFMKELKFSYFAFASFAIIISSIIGGFSIMCILENNAPAWELGLCLAVALTNNVVAIGQGPVRWVFNLFVVSIAVNGALILANTLFAS